MLKILFFLSFLLLQQLFALISIVPVKIGEKPGISGKAEARLYTKRGYSDKDFYKTSIRLNYDQNSSFVVWGEFSGEYGESNGIEDTYKLYTHLRLIHALTQSSIRDEYFLQAQEDKFKAIKKRRVAGAGLRFALFETLKGAKSYLGVGGFYESLRYINPTLDPNEDNIRLNTYLTYTAKFNKDSHLSYTMYYQPRIDKLSDHVLSNKFELSLHLYLKLFLKFNIYYDVDSAPPTGIESDYGFGQTTSFVYDF